MTTSAYRKFMESRHPEQTGNRFLVGNIEDLSDWCETPEGKEEAWLEENSYRRGYWDGVLQAIEYLRDGSDVRQLDYWLYNDLMRWKCEDCNDDSLPPSMVAWKKLRECILKAHEEICAYCGMPANHVDHVIPVCEGGSYSPDNLVAACQKCNLKKGTHFIEEIGMEINYPRLHNVVIVQGYNYATAEIVKEDNDATQNLDNG